MKKRKDADEGGGLAALGDDFLENIVGRLPAVSFASAACVCRSLRRVCARVLSRPKLASALSLNTCPDTALREVLDKVLSEPIRPHFAIVNAGCKFQLRDVLDKISKKLGPQTPIIVSHARGITGRDAITDEVQEEVWCFCRKWRENDVEYHDPWGILLTVGFVPGLKVDVIPLLQLDEEYVMVDKFIKDVGEYSSSVSGCPTPLGVIMFVGAPDDVNSVVEKIDFALPMEAALVGLEGSSFVYRSANDSRNVAVAVERTCTAAVALIFAKDRDGTPGSGEIMFHVVLSNGVSAVGPRYMDASVEGDDFLEDLTARREGGTEILNGVSVVEPILHEVGNGVATESFEWCRMFVGVTKRRRIAIGAENAKEITYLSFYGFYGIGEVEDYLLVEWVGIETGDCFQFYYADPTIALASYGEVRATLTSLKLGYDSNCESSHQLRRSHGNVDKREIFGGFIFSGCERGPSFFGEPNVNISPFVKSFPGVPVGGLFCHGEIARCLGSSNVKGNSKENSPRQCCHVFSTVYLVMSYTPFQRA